MRPGVDTNTTPPTGKRPAVLVERGFVIVKPDGRQWDKFFYARKDAAESVVRCCGADLQVFPARRVFSLRKASTTTARPHCDTIIDWSGQ